MSVNDELKCEVRTIDHKPFGVHIDRNHGPEKIVNDMLDAFYSYLKQFGTLYVRRGPKIERDRDFAAQVDLLHASFRVGLDTQGTPGEVVKVGTPTTQVFSLPKPLDLPPRVVTETKDKRVLL